MRKKNSGPGPKKSKRKMYSTKADKPKWAVERDAKKKNATPKTARGTTLSPTKRKKKK